MSRYRMWLLPAALAIAAALVIGPAAVAGPERAAAGTVVFIHDQEPPSLRPAWTDNSLYATSLVTNNIFLGGQIRDNNANWVTKLFTGAPKLLKKSPLTTQFTFSPKAELVRRQARHLRRLALDVADLDQPGEQPGEPCRVRGHQVGHV